MDIRILTNEDSFYAYYLTITNLFAPKSQRLRGKEIEVLAEIMRYNDKYESLSEYERGAMIFSKDIKAEIADKIGISSLNFNNILHELRKKGYIDKTRIKRVVSYSQVHNVNIIFDKRDDG